MDHQNSRDHMYKLEHGWSLHMSRENHKNLDKDLYISQQYKLSFLDILHQSYIRVGSLEGGQHNCSNMYKLAID